MNKTIQDIEMITDRDKIVVKHVLGEITEDNKQRCIICGHIIIDYNKFPGYIKIDREWPAGEIFVKPGNLSTGVITEFLAVEPIGLDVVTCKEWNEYIDKEVKELYND